MKLEELINENREAFDDREPGPGHFKRFRKKLYKSRSEYRYMIFRIAAVVTIGLIIGTLTFLYLNSGKKELLLTELSPDIQQTIYYYRSMNESKMIRIKEMEELDKSTRQRLINEVQKDDDELKSIVNDLQKFPEDERVKSALIEYYRTRSEFLDYVINQMEELAYYNN